LEDIKRKREEKLSREIDERNRICSLENIIEIGKNSKKIKGKEDD
jgi:hypothetical protein